MKHIYLVVERDPLVSNDVQETILEHDPAAAIATFASLDEAVARLATGSACLCTIIVNCSASLLSQSGLIGAIEATQAMLIHIDDDHRAGSGAVSEYWRHVKAPFTTDTLMQALKSLTCAAQEHPLACLAGKPA